MKTGLFLLIALLVLSCGKDEGGVPPAPTPPPIPGEISFVLKSEFYVVKGTVKNTAGAETVTGYVIENLENPASN